METTLRRRPFDSLPVEIVSMIMGFVCNCSENPIRMRHDVPLYLCLVSKSWKEISSSTQSLWSSLYAPAFHWFPHEYPDHLQQLEKRVARAGQLHLDLHLKLPVYDHQLEDLYDEDEYERMNRIFTEQFDRAYGLLAKFLETHSHKWRSIHLEFGESKATTHTILPSFLPNLKTATFSSALGLRMRDLNAPKLKYLNIDGEIHQLAWGKFNIPSVTDLTLACHPGIIVRSMLRFHAFKDLRTLYLSDIKWDDGLPRGNQLPFRRSWSIILPSLEELNMANLTRSISTRFILRAFRMPQLSLLYMRMGFKPKRTTRYSVEYPCLRTLAVTMVGINDVGAIQAILRGSPYIERLGLAVPFSRDQKMDGVECVDLQMRNLLFDDGGVSLCPHLRRLYTYYEVSPKVYEDISILLPDVEVSRWSDRSSSCSEASDDTSSCSEASDDSSNCSEVSEAEV